MGGITLVLVFAAFVAAGETVAVAAGMVLDNINENASLLVFFALSVVAVGLAWPLAVRFTARG